MTAASPSANGPTTGTGYRPVLRSKESDDSLSSKSQLADAEEPALYVRRDTHFRNATYILTFITIVLLSTTIYGWLPYAYVGGGLKRAGHGCDCSGPKPPQYFQTSPELWPGPTATGRAAFMAQTRVFEPTATFVPNEPLQTSIPIEGMQQGNESIFQMMGFLSPYSPSPGFGVNEYPIPEGADIVQVQMLSRHGARYPTSGSNVAGLGQKLGPLGDSFKPQGDLAFLKDWKYQLGAEILVPKGRQELYDSGVLHSYMYGKLYNPNSKLIVRTTTQDRMLKSAENWVSGFFGLEWTKNATIEVIIEDGGFNNSLAGSLNCPNASPKSTGGEAQKTWVDIYLKDAVERFNSMTSGFEWTTDDVYAAQNMCPYETVAYGYSRFCELFTYREWQDFGYSIDLAFSGSSAFHSPTGRAVGLGYQQEVMARLQNHTLGYSGSQINTTLDGMPETFPLNQSLYFDFSHDTNIASVLTAFGLVQFKEDLPADKNPLDHAYKIAHITPFGARLDIEVIRTPKPVSPNRDGYLRGGETKYVHFVLNQRTLPLGKSFPECGPDRRDGWCEFDTFVKVQEGMREKAQYEHACFGDYEAKPYGEVTDGAPV
ncbi:histidine phosphatase superfamily [Emericellopsis atlantica]|uniref:3-phytase n=1 Tax=Emericellopsis atlantica TaxID=2614577 RepID=A0A9P7ZT14_9HYPO|nr:histidine phosphatase superfamily [Emericellopsis atlantica]KAG9257813.1 histidine phosphatase superfamily [Emericellopsis atlantica]